MVRLIDLNKDYETIARWYIERDEIPCRRNLLPNIGFIADGVVAGFLYQTDSEVCFIESLISKKGIKNKEKSLDELTNHLIETAKEMKFKRIIFHTIHPKVKELGIKHGFKAFPNSQESFFKELR